MGWFEAGSVLEIAPPFETCMGFSQGYDMTTISIWGLFWGGAAQCSTLRLGTPRV